MGDFIDADLLRRTNPASVSLQTFLDHYNDLKTPAGSIYTSVFVQGDASSFYLPEKHVNRITDIDDTPTLYVRDEFFKLYEEMRRACVGSSALPRWSEKQTYYLPPFTPGTPMDQYVPNNDDDWEALLDTGYDEDVSIKHKDADENSDDSDDESANHKPPVIIPNVQYFNTDVSAEEREQATYVDNACIMLDFDIYQADATRQVTDNMHSALIQQTMQLLRDTLDLSEIKHDLFAAILCKKAPRQESHKTLGQCYKDSFHCRIFVRARKAVRQYIITKLRTDLLQSIFRDLKVLGKIEDILDKMSASVPAMLYGSAKRGAKAYSEFHSLYRISVNQHAHSICICDNFNTVIIPSKLKTRPDKIIHPKYNLAYELSLCYEDPRGMIKKPMPPIQDKLENKINVANERNAEGLISMNDLDATRRAVADLCARDFNARYLNGLLEILSPKRAENYEDWMKIIFIIAGSSREYKPLAYAFSQRCPQQFVKSGDTLEKLWERGTDGSSAADGAQLTQSTLVQMAKTDSPTQYEELKVSNTFSYACKMMSGARGLPNDTQLAELLYMMHSDRYICDKKPKAVTPTRVWYEFVFPTKRPNTDGMLYKWRCEDKRPDSLDLFISKKLGKFLEKVLSWIQDMRSGKEPNEREMKVQDAMDKNFNKTIHDLGQDSKIKNILARAEILFRRGREGFAESLDTDPNSIGVRNCVLTVYPRIKMINSYHEIPISRFCNANYVPYSGKRAAAKNVMLHELKHAIKMLFVHADGTPDKESYRYVMIFLSTSLDGRTKAPICFIWFGGGGNGKSFLLEMHTTTLGYVTDSGYGCKINNAYWTTDSRHGGPDSEKITMRNARSIYSSEFPAGSSLKMDKIKETTSEVLSGNDKNEKAVMFKVNAFIILGVNHIPKIEGKDYGTWRRIQCLHFKREFKSKEDYDPNNPLHCLSNRSWGDEAVLSPHYRGCYLGLLVHYYEKYYAGKYSYDITRVPHSTIIKETREYRDSQDAISRFITNFMRHRDSFGKLSPSSKQIVRIKLLDVANKYIKWYTRDVNPHAAKPTSDVIVKEFRMTELKDFIVTEHNVSYIKDYYCFESGEEQLPPGADCDGIDDDVDEDEPIAKTNKADKASKADKSVKVDKADKYVKTDKANKSDKSSKYSSDSDSPRKKSSSKQSVDSPRKRSTK